MAPVHCLNNTVKTPVLILSPPADWFQRLFTLLWSCSLPRDRYCCAMSLASISPLTFQIPASACAVCAHTAHPFGGRRCTSRFNQKVESLMTIVNVRLFWPESSGGGGSGYRTWRAEGRLTAVDGAIYDIHEADETVEYPR